MKNLFSNLQEIKGCLPNNKKITLVGGCFDLIHVGHVHLFEYAATLGDILVVAVLSDTYVSKYKGVSRPVINQDQRAKMVASIKFVDFVYITEISPSASETLKLLIPNSVVFCEDYLNVEKKKGRIEVVKQSSPQTNVFFLPRYEPEEVSSSLIIEKVKRSL